MAYVLALDSRVPGVVREVAERFRGNKCPQTGGFEGRTGGEGGFVPERTDANPRVRGDHIMTTSTTSTTGTTTTTTTTATTTTTTTATTTTSIAATTSTTTTTTTTTTSSSTGYKSNHSLLSAQSSLAGTAGLQANQQRSAGFAAAPLALAGLCRRGSLLVHSVRVAGRVLMRMARGPLRASHMRDPGGNGGSCCSGSDLRGSRAGSGLARAGALAAVLFLLVARAAPRPGAWG